MKKSLLLIIPVSIMALAAFGLASGADTINYQGRLMESAGAPVDGSSVGVTFSIHGVSSGGTALWSETQSISVAGGLYNVELGKSNPIPDDLFAGADRWLGVRVGGDAEMSPRARITSVAYAFNSRRIGGKKIQSGQGTLSVSGAPGGSVNVTFSEAFASPPRVLTGALDGQVGGITFIVGEVTNVTATGCTINFVSLDGSSSTGGANFDWIAIGE